MYAVIETGGKQYKVENGSVIFVEKLAAEENATVDFKVVALGSDDGIKVGAPYVEGATVTAKILESGKDDKVIVFKYRRKKIYRKFRGHRQQYTLVQIEAING